jgi:hypothetical protein
LVNWLNKVQQPPLAALVHHNQQLHQGLAALAVPIPAEDSPVLEHQIQVQHQLQVDLVDLVQLHRTQVVQLDLVVLVVCKQVARQEVHQELVALLGVTLEESIRLLTLPLAPRVLDNQHLEDKPLLVHENFFIFNLMTMCALLASIFHPCLCYNLHDLLLKLQVWNQFLYLMYFLKFSFFSLCRVTRVNIL